mmetsp:Transcript_59689/g.192077  ORF Transcript_59689/g.192077 Transcript_59689/m.192077 type:complete len:204 (-) Transcript_59689:407-1018(-)
MCLDVNAAALAHEKRLGSSGGVVSFVVTALGPACSHHYLHRVLREDVSHTLCRCLTRWFCRLLRRVELPRCDTQGNAHTQKEDAQGGEAKNASSERTQANNGGLEGSTKTLHWVEVRLDGVRHEPLGSGAGESPEPVAQGCCGRCAHNTCNGVDAIEVHLLLHDALLVVAGHGLHLRLLRRDAVGEALPQPPTQARPPPGSLW